MGKIAYIRKGAPERQKGLKRAKTKEQETKQGALKESMFLAENCAKT